ncbi:MAG: hypothetical protein ACK56F_12445, partial [bacterium]
MKAWRSTTLPASSSSTATSSSGGACTIQASRRTSPGSMPRTTSMRRPLFTRSTGTESRTTCA